MRRTKNSREGHRGGRNPGEKATCGVFLVAKVLVMMNRPKVTKINKLASWQRQLILLGFFSL
jgi:hypothetical protein